MKRALISCLLILLSSSYIFAQEIKDVILEADKLSYSEDGATVEANGNVTAVHKDVTIKAQSLTYRIKQGTLQASGGFKMDINGGVTLEGDELDYSLKDKKGVARRVHLYFDRSNMSGNKVRLDPDEFELSGSTFSGCGLERPHYHISASTITLYPEEGWVICYLGYFWFGDVPVVPIPAYIFDLNAGRTGVDGKPRNVPPLPEFGSNQLDGSYANTRFAWFINKKLNGKILVSWAENNGWGGGVEGDYLYDDKNSGNFRVYGDPRNVYYGGITHTYSFGQAIDSKNKYFFGIFNARDKLLFDFITNVSYRERINYERVSILPDVTLKMNDMPIYSDRLKLNASMTYGVVSEESSIRAGRGIYTANLDYSIPAQIGTFGLGLGYNQEWYEGNGRWTRVTQLTSYSNKWGAIEGYLGHNHYLLNEGASPFNYENYNLIRSDEILLKLSYNFDIHKVGINYDHYVPSWKPRDLDYIFTIGFHCYELELTYRAMRKEFLFGFSLVTR